jgi:hypothetical protein
MNTATPAIATAPKTDIVCFGVMCPRHGHCVRYLAVDGATFEPVIATCQQAGANTWPMYQAARMQAATAKA